jgi:hypothetical protein
VQVLHQIRLAVHSKLSGENYFLQSKRIFVTKDISGIHHQHHLIIHFADACDETVERLIGSKRRNGVQVFCFDIRHIFDRIDNEACRDILRLNEDDAVRSSYSVSALPILTSCRSTERFSL